MPNHRYDLEPLPDVQSGFFHVYVYSRSEKQLVYVGGYLDKQAAMQNVRRSVAALGLRCLFYWDEAGNYRCGSDDKHVYGRIALERFEIVNSVEVTNPLPFDEQESP